MRSRSLAKTSALVTLLHYAYAYYSPARAAYCPTSNSRLTPARIHRAGGLFVFS